MNIKLTELQWKNFMVISVALMFLVYLCPSTAEAHSNLEKTFPESGIRLDKPPESIELWFEDPVTVHSDSLKVFDHKGNKVLSEKPYSNSKDPRHVILYVKEKLPPGVYTVQYNVITLDGYVARDEYKFEVNKPVEDPQIQEQFRLIKSSPLDGEISKSGPAEIDLWFSQPAEVTALGVFGKDTYIIAGDPSTDPNDPKHITVPLQKQPKAGTYQVTWYAAPIERDGPLNQEYVGLFYFSVNEVTTLVSNPNKVLLQPFYNKIGVKHVAHWFAFLGLLALAGGTWFQTFITGKSGNLKRWTKASSYLYAVSVIGFALLVIHRRLELPEISFKEFLSLKFVWIPVLQIALMSLSMFVLRGRLQLAGLVISVLLWPISSGHSTYPRYGGYYAVGLDVIHMLAISVWLGGLLALLLMIPKDSPIPWLKESGRKYTNWALCSMVLIIFTGFMMTVQYVPSFTLTSLMASDWGKALLLKLILVFAIVAVAFWQRRTIQRISEQGLKTLVRRGRIELLYALIILFAAAILIESTPSAVSQGIYPKRMVKEEMYVKVDISPLSTETNDILLEFANQPPLKQVKVRLFMPPDWIKENTAFDLGDGKYKLTGNFLHGSGTIMMEVVATRMDGTEVVFPVRIVVPGELRMSE